MLKFAVFLKPYKKETILGPLFKLIEAILELLLPTMVALMINHGVGKGDTHYVWQMGLLMLLMTILGFGSSLVCQFYAARASQGFGTTLRNTMFKHISSFSYADLDKFGTPSLINRITNDVNQLQTAVAMLIRLVIRAPFICIGAIIMSMILDFRLALVLLAATPVLALILYVVITKASPLYQLYQKKLDKIALVLSENLTGVRVIRAFAKRGAERVKFNTASDDLTQTAIRVGRISALLSPATLLVVNGAIIAILWIGGIHIQYGSLTQGEIIAFINYITQILLALIVVTNLIILFTKAATSAARIQEVLDTEASISDTANSASFDQGRTGKISPVPAISFDHVSFGYNKTGQLALSDVVVDIYPGETVGIIGGTGSGKSTFVNLIPRFYDAVEGCVRVDGIDVRHYKLEQLRQKIGIVPQKALLFTGSIADNIRWGHEHATDEEVARAAAIAQADEFISNLPEKFDAPITRGGLNLSGGQKQRLTIARAIVGNPEILILDDSSSALDFATDAALRKSLRENSTRMTVLLVSQRVSSVQHADKIIVFDEGRIVGIGTHDQLMSSSEVYQEINRSQLSTQEVDQ
ncbi:ABC transporter ATP-binding protein [Paenibacillus polymyxa]|uniref:ABC transporter ATP-binding protein n=1 Tax=Paenibacillus TaxID=44249 RepID=UPI0004DED299|nr:MULTISPECIES: ABC transporter ATP-binding protein [Paenibacillus]KAF6651422.1 ABC transporter ATP-binding protein [Paenibacillus sp. EKM301P]MBY7737774.1 ABC transporter ATP-binding protein/permease [Paenibacillus polymyxa]RGL30597.1 ABC transporter ATP-binding protein [Paenibacillus polymyxa]RPE11416.1 ABC transporter ATP-binding protein [Paenibacillus polymyxa]UBS87448.1 ABC transporter ATP-binding protein/permease [Paenibacillus polymyxa]